MAIINEGIKVRVGGDTTGLSRSLKKSKLDAGAWAAGMVAAITGVITASAKMAASLDKDLRLVATLQGESTEAITEMRIEVQRMAREFGRSMNVLAQARYQAVSAGFKDINESMEIVRAGTELSIAGNADLVGSTEAVAKSMKAFRGEAMSAGEAAAFLWGITRDGLITVEGLNRFLKDLPSTFAITGIRSEELAAAISTLTGETGSAERAMDQLRQILIKTEQEGITGTFVERIERLSGKGLPALMEILGSEVAATGVLTLAASFGTLTTNVDLATKVTEDFTAAANIMADASENKWARVWEGLKSVAINYGTGIDELTKGPLDRLANKLDEIADSMEREKLLEIELTRLSRLNEMRPLGTPSMTAPEALAIARRRVDASRGGPVIEGIGGLFPIAGGGMGAFSQAVQQFSQAVAVIPGVGPEAFVGGLPGAGITRSLSEEYPFVRGGPIAGSADIFGTTFDDFVSGSAGIMKATEEQIAIEERKKSAVEEATFGQIFAANAVLTLADTLGNQLVGAMGLADSAVGRFIGSLLQQTLRLGAESIVSSILPFHTGGYTGATGGIVHGNEFVFNSQAVDKIGLGRLERMHRLAGGGTTVNFQPNINVTGISGDPSSIAGATQRGVAAAWRDARISGVARHYEPMTLGGA